MEQQLVNTEPNYGLAKKLNIAALLFSAVVFILVVAMRRIELNVPVDFSFLPAVYSGLNALTALLLILGFVQIKKKNIDAHKKIMGTALLSSALFLVLYVLYHITTPATTYCGQGTIRTVYFFLLITHIVLAAGSLPFILLTFIRSYTGQIAAHRKMAKWVFPFGCMWPSPDR